MGEIAKDALEEGDELKMLGAMGSIAEIHAEGPGIRGLIDLGRDMLKLNTETIVRGLVGRGMLIVLSMTGQCDHTEVTTDDVLRKMDVVGTA